MIRSNPALSLDRNTGDVSSPPGTSRAPVVLAARAISAGYGEVPVIKRLDLEVRAGEVVALLGANGAGKSTTLLALAGELPLTEGTTELLGEAVRGPLHRRSKRGLGFVPEERSVLAKLSVGDNLRLGSGSVEDALADFPELVPLLKRKAGLLSGGEQQILTLARALASRPAVLLADELSLGLAPLVVKRLFVALRSAADKGVGVLFVEQQIRTALAMSDRAYVLNRGELVMSDRSAELLKVADEIERSYLSD